MSGIPTVADSVWCNKCGFVGVADAHGRARPCSYEPIPVRQSAKRVLDSADGGNE